MGGSRLSNTCHRVWLRIVLSCRFMSFRFFPPRQPEKTYQCLLQYSILFQSWWVWTSILPLSYPLFHPPLTLLFSPCLSFLAAASLSSNHKFHVLYFPLSYLSSLLSPPRLLSSFLLCSWSTLPAYLTSIPLYLPPSFILLHSFPSSLSLPAPLPSSLWPC